MSTLENHYVEFENVKFYVETPCTYYQAISTRLVKMVFSIQGEQLSLNDGGMLA